MTGILSKGEKGQLGLKYCHQVCMVSWDWMILSLAAYGQLGLKDTITGSVRSVVDGENNQQVSTVIWDWGIHSPGEYSQLRLVDTIQKVVRSARAMGNNHKVSMVSWDRRIQLPIEYYQLGLGDRILLPGKYVSWDWGIQLPGKCGQLEPKDTINRWVHLVVAGDNIYRWKLPLIAINVL